MIFKHSFFALAVCLVLFGQGASLAHPQKAAIATIELNSRSGVVEIIHRFSQHDAEHAAHLFGATPESIVTNTKVQKEFADYVVNSFGLSELNGKNITLSQVGYEFDEGYIWVYQEANLSHDTHGLKVHYSALQEIWPDQTNTVNVKLDGSVRTLLFTGRTKQLEVLFEKSVQVEDKNEIASGSHHDETPHSHGSDTHTH